MINLSKLRRGMGCASCNGACGGCNKGVGRVRRGIGVMVCCDDEGNLYDDGSTDVLGGSAPSPISGGDIYTSPVSNVPGVVTLPTNNSSQNLNLLGQALQAAGTAAQPIVKLTSQQAPYYITNPQTGQSVLYNPNTGAVASGTTGASIFGTSATSGLSPLLLLGGLVLVAMMAGKH